MTLDPIQNRDDLILALRDAAELEHQFMCMYLYAAFSYKKEPDASCNTAQLEVVRRWASTMYMIARQEMEHLSLVQSMLAAIGAPPHFARQNIPAQSPHFLGEVLAQRAAADNAECPPPCDLPFLLEPFHLRSSKRYACMESAELRHLTDSQRPTVLEWCFKDEQGQCPCVLQPQVANAAIPLHRSYGLGLASNAGGIDTVHVGTIEEYYDRIKAGFITVSAADPNLFVGECDRHQVEILSEYDIYIFPVTNLTSACNAIDLITKQGEGLGGQPGFESHFLNFYDMSLEYENILGVTGCNGAQPVSNFNPAYPLPWDPTPADISNEFTLKIFELFNYSYVSLLYVLTGLYGWYRPQAEESDYPHFSAALRELAYAPAMTMLIRSLGEVLAQLPLAHDLQHRAGPDFYITAEEDARLFIESTDYGWQNDPNVQFYTNISFYLERFDEIIRRLDLVLNDPEMPQHVATQLTYIHQNVYRMTGNLRQIYQTGVYSKFRVFP